MADTARDYRARLYETYATEHSGVNLGPRTERALVAQILTHLPATGRMLDIGAGQGALVRLMASRGYDALGIDLSPEQVAIGRQHGIDVREADLRGFLQDHAAEFDGITAIDLLEHFDKPDVLPILDLIYGALKPGGVLVVRTPNGSSPFAGRLRYGDFTHGTIYASRSVRQLTAAAGFESVALFDAPPVAHGVISLARLLIWRLVAAACKLALAAETGERPRAHIVTQNLVFRAVKGGF
jgi:2-polyprenyl-3-methyl-5-hydroxy-6-metoxy-1,4-benzoquinol methylase